MKARSSSVIVWTVISTLGVEAIRAYLRFRGGITATEFNKTAPLLLQIHHMFLSIPLLLVLPLVWRKPRLSGALLGIALGLIFSDLSHHFLVLSLDCGQYGLALALKGGCRAAHSPGFGITFPPHRQGNPNWRA